MTNPLATIESWLTHLVANMAPRYTKRTYTPPQFEGPFRYDLMALHDIPTAGTEAEADYANIRRIPR